MAGESSGRSEREDIDFSKLTLDEKAAVSWKIKSAGGLRGVLDEYREDLRQETEAAEMRNRIIRRLRRLHELMHEHA